MNSTRDSITKTSKTFVINKHIKLENTISPHIKTFDLVSSLLTEGKKIHVISTDNVKNVTVNNNDDDYNRKSVDSADKISLSSLITESSAGSVVHYRPEEKDELGRIHPMGEDGTIRVNLTPPVCR